MSSEESRLGEMKRLPLRTRWRREAEDFTPWLAENIGLLAETLGLEGDLELVVTEKSVGSYRADLVCTSVAGTVVVENQLGDTDHKHLGQLMTYGGGERASTLIWIAERFRPEHRAALDWLNAITDETDFLGLEIELWQIDDSKPAAKFNIVAKPNDWSRTTTRRALGGLSGTKRLQLTYWTAFRDVLERSGGPARAQKARPQQWINIAIGRTGFKLAAVINTQAKWIRAELYIESEPAKAYFAALKDNCEEIEAALGFGLDWQDLPRGRACRVAVFGEFDPADEATWDAQHEWLADRLNRMHLVLAPHVKALDPV